MSSLDWTVLTFVTLVGACVGSFLNVVAYRVPRGLSVVHPPSSCPGCGKRIEARDNIPVLGWLLLRGKCRACGVAISARYPLIEAFTAALMAVLFLSIFVWGLGPAVPDSRLGGLDPITLAPVMALADVRIDWPVLLVYALATAVLLGLSLIDAETFSLPLVGCYLLAAVGLVGQAFLIGPDVMGSMAISIGSNGEGGGIIVCAMTAGAMVGLGLSLLLMWLGVLPRSFKAGSPLLMVEVKAMEEANAQARAEGKPIPFAEPLPKPMAYGQICKEMTLEMLFLLPVLLLSGAAGWWVLSSESNMKLAAGWLANPHFSAVLISLCGGLVAAGLIWLTRIFGTLAFKREAMGLGDVHLMFGIGCVVGPVAGVAVFFVAPFAGLAIGIYGLLSKRQSELPYGPYLAAAAYVLMLFHGPVVRYIGTHTWGAWQGLLLNLGYQI